jgi:hypothetical protein
MIIPGTPFLRIQQADIRYPAWLAPGLASMKL